MRRPLLQLVVFAAVVLVALRLYRPAADAPGDGSSASVTSAGPSIEYRDQRPRNIFEVPPAAMPEALRASYRLRPDRRVLLAVPALHALATGEEEPALAVDFRDGRWHLIHHDRVIGELPELASFEDAWTLLTGVAAATPFTNGRTRGDLAPVRAALAEFSVRRLAHALELAGAEWRAGARNEEVLGSAVQGLLGLVLQGHDPLDRNDALLARALAATALLDRLGADTRRERALLADLLGYSRDARRIASDLPAADPLRAFVLREHEKLRGHAEQPEASRFVRQLYLMRLAERGDVEAWSDWMSEHAGGITQDLGRFRTAFLLHDFSANRRLSRVAPYLVLLESWHVAHPKAARLLRWVLGATDPDRAVLFGQVLTGGQPARLLGEFEATLRRVGVEQSGPFLDSLAYREYFRGYMYGAFFTYSRFVLDQLSSVTDTEDLAAALNAAPAGLGSDVARWNRALLTSMQGDANIDELIATLAESRVGGSGLSRTFDELTDRTDSTDPRLLQAARHLALGLDARPANVSRFADVAHNQLMDMRLAGQLYAHLERVAGDTRAAAVAWLHRMRGDGAAIRRLVEDTSLDFDDRSYALTTLIGMDGAAEADIRAAFERLMQEDPLEWDIRKRYIDYLEKRDDYTAAGNVAADWLDRAPANGDFEEIYARTALARSLERRGELDRAWSVIRPVVWSSQAGAMERAAIVRARLNDADRALQIARRAVDRYPHVPHAHASLAEVHWILGDHAAAAAVLKGAAGRLTWSDWNWTVGESLYRAIGDRPPGEAARAAEALVAAGVDPFALLFLSFELSRRKQYEHVLEITSRAGSPNLLADIDLKTAAYRNVRRLHGDDAALAWLQQRLPHGMMNHASIIFYRRREWHLLWDLIPEPERGPYTSVVWLYRAAAAVQEGFSNHPRRNQLLAHYARGSADPYDVMGRHLVGLASEAELLAIATAPDRLCEVAYYLGLRAMAEERYAAASDWFRIVHETGLSNEGEYGWATSLLNGWKTDGVLTRFPAEATR